MPHNYVGPGESWPEAVVVDDRSPERLRVRSAALSYGDTLPTSRWLSDGSGFIALFDDQKFPGPPSERASYRLVRPDTRTFEFMRIPRGGGREWYDRVYTRGPEPCPWDAALVAVGRTSVVNHRTGVTLASALMTDRSGPDHLDPWSGRPGEMVFSWPHGGHGGRSLPSLIRPSFATAPPREPFTFRVGGTGDCLNLRAGPAVAAPVVGCYADGTLVTLVDISGAPDPEAPAFLRDDDGAWLHVSGPGGTVGWVSSTYVQWADAT